MPTVERSFTVDSPAQRVISYLKDFGNAEEWDPGTESCTRIDSGPLRVGCRWRNMSKILGVSTELEYVLKEATDSTLVFEGRNDSVTSTDTIVVTPAADGAKIHYRADLKMHGLAVVMAPAMKLLFEKIAGDTKKQMTEVLNKLPA